MEQKMYMNYIHPSSLLRQLADLWRTDQLCDAVITVDKTIVAKAHKLVLFAVSPKLKADSKNSAQSAFLDVCLPSGLSHKSVNAFLQYLYEGFLLLTQDLVTDMIRIAEFLEISCLLNCCSDFHKQCSNSGEKPSPPAEFTHVRWMAMTDVSSKRASDDTSSGKLSPSLQQKRRKILASRSEDNVSRASEPVETTRTVEHDTVDLTDSCEETSHSFAINQPSPHQTNQNLSGPTPNKLNQTFPATSTPKTVDWHSQRHEYQDEPLPRTVSIKVENSQTGESECIQANVDPPPDDGDQPSKSYNERDGQYTTTEGSSNMYTQDSIQVKLEPSDDYSVSCESDSNTGQTEMFHGDWFPGDGSVPGTSDGQLTFETTGMQMEQFMQQGTSQKGPQGNWQASQFSRNQSNDGSGNMSIEMAGTSQEVVNQSNVNSPSDLSGFKFEYGHNENDCSANDGYRCEICGKVFYHKRYLKRHISTTHSEYPQHKCHICNNAYKFGTNLRRHIRETHEPKISPIKMDK